VRVLLAVDGSPDTKKMLAYLSTHEELLGSQPELFVLNVQPKVPPRVTRFFNRKALEEYYLVTAESVLAPVSKFLERHNADFDAEHRAGHADEEILAHAERKKVDMIVMGSHGHSAIGSLFLGSVAQKVLTQSKVPVLIVR
jgi:nucleotide-binding universal stress UspA family protein